MANEDHIARLKEGVDAWNAWRAENPHIRPDLQAADLSEANLREANLTEANLRGADFMDADLSGADLTGADLSRANLIDANLNNAKLGRAVLYAADLGGARLGGANLNGASLTRVDLGGANLSRANLGRADLWGANLSGADFSGADLRRAHLGAAALVETNLTDADLTNCYIYGVSAWGVNLEGARQQNLIITYPDDPNEITVDNIEVAQFVYLLLHNPKIRDVIDTVARKAVLILGRFTPERKAVLNDLREGLRKRDYVPIQFDFDKPASQDLTATVSTLAHLARFIIADLSDPSSIPYELATVVPTTPVPVQPILLSGNSEFAMFADLRRRYHWVLPTHHYDTSEQLIADLDTRVIRPAETKVLEVRGTQV